MSLGGPGDDAYERDTLLTRLERVETANCARRESMADRQARYAARRAAWRGEAEQWLATRPLPGSPRTLGEASEAGREDASAARGDLAVAADG